MTKRAKAPRERAGVRLALGFSLVALAELVCPPARATEAEPVTLEEDTSAQAPAPAPKEEDAEPKVKHVPARYSLPWQLRPVLPVNLVRSDTSFSFYGVDGATIVSELGASYKIIPQIAILARIAVANDSPPTGSGAFGFVNPLIGGQAGFWPAKSLKLGLFLGVTVPLGMGGGLNANPAAVETVRAAMLARSGFDNPLLMPDYFTAWPGVDIAYVTHGFTFQGEASMALMARVRGPDTEKSSNVDLTLGLHVGYFLFPFLSAGLDFRHQRWLSTPAFVADDPTGEIRDLTTIEVGVRFHVKLSDDITWRPGLAMAFGLDDPIAAAHYKTVHIDLPFQF
jgi:hypothetical protein